MPSYVKLESWGACQDRRLPTTLQQDLCEQSSVKLSADSWPSPSWIAAPSLRHIGHPGEGQPHQSPLLPPCSPSITALSRSISSFRVMSSW